MNKIKNHPGFMPFGWSNKKVSSSESKDSEERRENK